LLREDCRIDELAICRARSDSEFIAKIGIALEEADESKGWLELLVSSNQVSLWQRKRDA